MQKITEAGQLCRKCETPVIAKTIKHDLKKLRPNQIFWFVRYFICPKCRTVYMDERSKEKISVT